MNRELILNFFRLGAELGKFSEDDLKTPQGQAMVKAYADLSRAYIAYKDSVNGYVPEGGRSEIDVMNDAVVCLAKALDELSKTRDVSAESEAFGTVVEFVKKHIGKDGRE